MKVINQPHDNSLDKLIQGRDEGRKRDQELLGNNALL
jgi:hypothetical protein